MAKISLRSNFARLCRISLWQSQNFTARREPCPLSSLRAFARRILFDCVLIPFVRTVWRVFAMLRMTKVSLSKSQLPPSAYGIHLPLWWRLFWNVTYHFCRMAKISLCVSTISLCVSIISRSSKDEHITASRSGLLCKWWIFIAVVCGDLFDDFDFLGEDNLCVFVA